MLGLIPPTDDGGTERARLVAGSALMLLALFMLLHFIGGPPRVDASPSALRAERIAAFQDDVPACRAALMAAGFETSVVPDMSGPGGCGYVEAVALTRSAHAYSQPVAGRCAMAAALALWERDVVAPAAARHLGQAVARIELAGPAYSCRRVAGRTDRRLSEHGRGNAIDIRGFLLADGREVSVLAGWRGDASERAFLRAVRDGACEHFHGVLSPDYNRAHRDHFHFDLGAYRMCR